MSDWPLIVAAGVLTEQEFALLKAAEQVEVEETARDLVKQYGWDSLRRDRERQRSDLWFVYGVPDD